MLSPGGMGASSVELLWRKWLLLATAPVAGVIVAAGVWSIFFSSRQPELPPVAAVEKPTESPVAETPAPPEEPAEPLPKKLDRRWLPDGTRLLLSLRCAHLAQQPSWNQVIDRAAPVWRPTVGTLLQGLGLKLRGITRLTWASTDLEAWPEQSVVIVELQPGQNAELLVATGEAVDVGFDGVACRRRPGAVWPHPYAIIDQRTIVTGDAELLRRLAGRREPKLESRPIRQLLKADTEDADAVVLVDLAAARAAAWRLPSTILDVWSAGKQPWHVVWEVPDGLGCTLKCSEGGHSELALVCEGETPAEQVRAAVGELMSAAGESLAAQIAALPERLQAGHITAAAAHQYELLLKEGLAISQAAGCEVIGDTVWLRVDWRQHPSALAGAAAHSQPAIEADWLAAAHGADRANYERLVKGLGGYAKSEGRYPRAAAGGALMPPETRLSWIATMLPYYGHPDWHGQLEFGYPWNGPQNRDVTRQSLPEVVNPLLGPAKTDAGFPVTHYVGVAGIGADAGRLKASDPRAGIFGFGRDTRREDIADGAAHTIAILGVVKDPGPWAAGGPPTVRALTQRPYVNGPDGFGSGQADGMFAGMADGSVRFISKDIDPSVLEQLATINGQENVTVAALDPESASEPPEIPDKAPPEVEPPPEETTPPPESVVQKVAPPQVDVQARLADKIPQIDLDDVPLGQAVGFLSAMSTLPVTFDADAMAQLGVTLRDPVTVRLSDASIGQILEAAVSSRGLVVVVENGQLLLTGPPQRRETLRRMRYTVSDLTGQDAAAVADLAAVVEKLVWPESWHAGGGRGTIAPDGGALLVTQTAVVHREILFFCEKLRQARGKPLRSKLDPEWFALTTRRDRAHEKLSQPVTVNFHEPAPLIEILGFLGALTETDFLVDRVSLAATGTSDQMEVALNVSEQPLDLALEELLAPLGLAYRVIDAQTIQVATRKDVDARLEVEFYPTADLLAGARSVPTVVERIKGRVAGSTWSDAGGPGVLHVDQPSGCLIVLQSQPMQAALQRVLAELRAERVQK